MIDERSPWHRVTRDEWLELRPYILDCADLSQEICKQVRGEFESASIAGLKRITVDLGRMPHQAEADILRASLTRWFNDVRIPELASEAMQ